MHYVADIVNLPSYLDFGWHVWCPKWKQKKVGFVKLRRRESKLSWIVKSVLNSSRHSSISDNGASEPARVLLERLFAQTQKLEQQIGRDPSSPGLGVGFGELESELHAALVALKNKEEDLQDAERKLVLEFNEIHQARKSLERREDEMAAATLKQEKLEEELRVANVELASRALEISDLKLQLKEKDDKISASQLALLVKEEEIGEMERELMKKTDEAADAESQLRFKSELLDEANKVVEKQALELQQLQRVLREKEEELGNSIRMQESESEKLKNMEAKLEKQTMDWLIAQEELRKLAEQTSKHVGEANSTLDEFGRVKKLISDVKCELVSSQKVLASSKEKMESQDRLLEEQLNELEELRQSIMSYLPSLRDAEVEVENERVKLRVAEAQNEELKRDLLLEKELVAELQTTLDKERSALKQAVSELSALCEEIDSKNAAFEQSQILLTAKESELVEARLEIQHLKSELVSLQLVLEQKNSELSDAKEMLEELSHLIAELKGILSSREEELIGAVSELKEKGQHVLTMQHELTNAQLKFSEAEAVVGKIVDLTNEVVLSLNDQGYYTLIPTVKDNHGLSSPLLDRPPDSSKWQVKQLETELEFTRETLRAKEMEVLAANKDLITKDEELNVAIRKLDAKEKEIAKLREGVMQDTDLKQLYALSQEIIGEKGVGEVAIEKLQLEAAQLEVEAATTALERITELSRQLLHQAGLSIEAENDILLRDDDSEELDCSLNVSCNCVFFFSKTSVIIVEEQNEVHDYK
ncbi:hypothetical protein SASPL_130994 [Salvia splendens]|uniref:Uncharacterized protein n=1 Tax=Salvia splendens TaxID=180675 RepID=A0A8X8X7Y6_SALSN|nr:hypothetical protein SASPL_130994 [Salvia splendens]